MGEWWLPAVAGCAALLCLVLVVALLRAHRRTRLALEAALEEQSRLREQVAALGDELRPAAGPSDGADVPDAPEFLITDVGRPQQQGSAPAVPERIEGRLFADIVLRETVVKAASWAHGLRQALSPEHRARLRVEVRRETRRSARRRKADVKEALRQYYARERGDVA